MQASDASFAGLKLGRAVGPTSRLAAMVPRKMPNAPKIIFGLACIASVCTATYAIMSRSIDKDDCSHQYHQGDPHAYERSGCTGG